MPQQSRRSNNQSSSAKRTAVIRLDELRASVERLNSVSSPEKLRHSQSRSGSGSASKKRQKLYMRASDIIKQRNIETRATTNILRVNRESQSTPSFASSQHATLQDPRK